MWHFHWPGPAWVVRENSLDQSVSLECFGKYMTEILIFILGKDHI